MKKCRAIQQSNMMWQIGHVLSSGCPDSMFRIEEITYVAYERGIFATARAKEDNTGKITWEHWNLTGDYRVSGVSDFTSTDLPETCRELSKEEMATLYLQSLSPEFDCALSEETAFGSVVLCRPSGGGHWRVLASSWTHGMFTHHTLVSFDLLLNHVHPDVVRRAVPGASIVAVGPMRLTALKRDSGAA